MTALNEASVRTEVFIAGGGMTGLTLGLALAREGVDVIVADAQVAATQLAPTYDGRASAIAYASFRMWEALRTRNASRKFW